MNDKERFQQLALAQALYKKLGEIVGTKDPTNLRGECDAALRGMFEETGADRVALRINGEKVGELGVNVTSEKREQRLEIDDWDAFGSFTFEPETLMDYILSHGHPQEQLRLLAEWYFEETGELPDGCELVEQLVPGGAFKSTTIRGCKFEKVQAAIGKELPAAAVALIEE